MSRGQPHPETASLLVKLASSCVVVALTACAPRPETPVELWFGGDVHLGTHGAEILRPLSLHGLGVINLEGPIASGEATADRLINGAQAPAALAQNGVRVAWVDNNHSADDGASARARTIGALHNADIAAADLTMLDGLSFLGVDLSHGLPPDLAERIDSMSGVRIVGFHVLAEPLLLPEPVLEQAVELAVAHHARIIVAQGTHAIARVERRKETIIAWGLGNLAFSCACTDEKDGLVVEVGLDGDATSAWVLPINAGLRGQPAQLSQQPKLIFDLLESLGSSPLQREGARARF